MSPKGETRWPAAAAVAVSLLVQVFLTDRLVPGPPLLLPGLEALLLLGLLAGTRHGSAGSRATCEPLPSR